MQKTCLTDLGESDVQKAAEKTELVALLTDTKFETGINLLGRYPWSDGEKVFGKLTYGGTAKETKEPLWRFAQWMNRCLLSEELEAGRSKEVKQGDTYIYEDPCKTFKVNPKSGQIDLIYRSSADYLEPRKADQAWSHMLLEQDFVNPMPIKELAQVHVAMDYTINSIENKMKEGECNPGIHAVQLCWFMRLANTSETEGEYGDFIWFGIPLYDNRGMDQKELLMYDPGTQKYIYGMKPRNYLGKFMTDTIGSVDIVPVGTDMKFDFDVCPYFRETFEKVQQAGGMKGVRFENLALTNMNMGWELPGTFDVDATIRSIDIYGIKK